MLRTEALVADEQATVVAFPFFREMRIAAERLELNSDLVADFAELVSCADMLPQLISPKSGDFRIEIQHLGEVLKRVCAALQSSVETQDIVDLANRRIPQLTEQDIDIITEKALYALNANADTRGYKQESLHRARMLADDAKRGSYFSFQSEVDALSQIAQSPTQAYLKAVRGLMNYGVAATRANINARHAST